MDNLVYEQRVVNLLCGGLTGIIFEDPQFSFRQWSKFLWGLEYVLIYSSMNTPFAK
jgi:hypothetical protein